MNKLYIIACLFFFTLPGCVYYVPEESVPHSYYRSPDKDVQTIGRVALIEVKNPSMVYFVSADVSEVLFQEIQKKQIFGITYIPKDDDQLLRLQMETDSNYSFEQLELMQKTFKCDAVLTGTITEYKPYPHMILGLRLRLIDLSDGQLLWAMEQVWDTTDKTTRNRIEAFYSPKRVSLYTDGDLKGQLGVVSSLKFFKFVAHEVSQTLISE